MITSAPPAPAELRTQRESADASATAWALAARAGDADAVDHFVRALHHDVLRYVSYLCADPQAVDDLAQDTFLRALGSLHRFEGRSSARAWLLSIARRAVIDNYRYASARPRLADVDDWQDAAERAQERGLPGFEDGIALADLLSALPATPHRPRLRVRRPRSEREPRLLLLVHAITHRGPPLGTAVA